MTVITALPFGPEVTEAVLQHLATVPYSGDHDAYIVEASHAIAIAAKRATLEAQMRIAQREFDEFRRMATPTTIQ